MSFKLPHCLAMLIIFVLLVFSARSTGADTQSCCQIYYGKCTTNAQNILCTSCASSTCSGKATIYTIFVKCMCEFTSGTTSCLRNLTPYYCKYQYNCLQNASGCVNGPYVSCDPDYDNPIPVPPQVNYNWSATGGACSD
ncbi:MAG: hypothetical protein ABI579_01100 [Candidatus Sumerlaeota bacterium]